MGLYDNLKIKKIKSPKSKQNPVLKDYKKELKETPLYPKKIKILSLKKKKISKDKPFIPTELSFKENTDVSHILEKIEKVNKVKKVNKVDKVDSIIDEPVPNMKVHKIKKKTKKNDRYKSKTISVKINDKGKDKNKELEDILTKFSKMKISDIQSKLNSKGIKSKSKNKNKLLKYMYLLTCVDDNINIIKD